MAKPRMRAFAQTITLDRILVFFDGPQVILFQSDRGLPAVGVSVGEPEGDFYPLYITEVSPVTWHRYVREKVDLRYLFRDGSKKRYLADWGTLEEDRLKLKKVDKDLNDEDFVPASGFWSRHQTTTFEAKAYATDTVESFAIDGAWDASDFSRFYGRAADLYAYLTISARGAAAKLSFNALEAVGTAIRSQSFQGGGSYVGFYDKIFNSVDAFSPLRVKRIAYASPGHIDLQGSQEALADVAKVVQSFGADYGEVNQSYKAIDDILKRQNLKRAAPGTQFATQALSDLVYSESVSLNRRLGVDAPEELFELCDRNVLVFAKVSLSFYRRARDLHAFHAEGRVTAT